MQTETQTEDLLEINAMLSAKDARERIAWAVGAHAGEIILSTSFGAQSALMLDLVLGVAPETPVVFVDTGYLFPETYRFSEELKERFPEMRLHTYVPRMSAAHQEALFGELWAQGREGLETYGRINKVEPMNRALTELGARAWLSGLRRGQASSRQNLRVVEKQNRTFKIHPIIDWSEREVYHYMKERGLPFHPLWHKGYVSIGDRHSTRTLAEAGDAEATRFNGVKRECGLHEMSGQGDWQI